MNRWYLRIASYARPQVRALLGVLALVLAIAAVEALKPWPMKLIVDNVLARQPLPSAVGPITRLPGAGSPVGLVGWLTAATVFLFLVSHGIKMAQSYIQAGASARMCYKLGADLFEHIQRLSLRFHSRSRTGDLVQRVMTDANCVRLLTLNVMVPLVTSTATLAMMFVVMLRLDVVLTVAALAVIPFLWVGIRLFATDMEERSYEQSELQGQMMGLAEQTLTAIPIVQAFGREPHEDRRFSELTERTGRAYLRTIRSQLGFKTTTSTATALGTAAILLFGGLHVLDGTLSVGTLLVFLSYLGSLYQPLESLAYLSSGYASAAAGARRVLQVLDEHDYVQERPDAIMLPARSGGQAPAIVFDDVTFGYEPGTAVLKHVTMAVDPGETVALVGATGSGKSTLVSLIPRLFDPWTGSVALDGIDLKCLKLENLRAQIAVVLQEPHLFPVTVAENIAYGRPSASRADIVKAAQAARADDFIRRLSDGYDTVIGERGATLSGGERQRLSIARAFLKDAPVLLLDEPTSALDAQTEAELVDAMLRLMQGRTTVIVAHRLSMIRDVNRIFVLEAGQLVESGTATELLASQGPYKRFYELNSGRQGRHPGHD